MLGSMGQIASATSATPLTATRPGIAATSRGACSSADRTERNAGTDAVIERPGPYVPERFYTRLQLVSLADPDAAPEVVELSDPIPVLGGRVCGAAHVSIVGDGTAEWVFDVTERAVTRIESNSREAGVQGALQIDGHDAISPDGATHYATGRGRTWSRTGLEPWQNTGLELVRLWATDTAVLGVDATTNEVVELASP